MAPPAIWRCRSNSEEETLNFIVYRVGFNNTEQKHKIGFLKDFICMKNQQRVDKKDFGRDLGKKDRVFTTFSSGKGVLLSLRACLVTIQQLAISCLPLAPDAHKRR